MTVRTTLILMVLGTLALTACGRKGPLDTPYQAAVEAREQAERDDQPLPPEPQRPTRDRRFILDGLI